MVLFDAKGVIKRYETAEDILREFFELRMEYYSRRRLALIQVRSELPACMIARSHALSELPRWAVENVQLRDSTKHGQRSILPTGVLWPWRPAEVITAAASRSNRACCRQYKLRIAKTQVWLYIASRPCHSSLCCAQVAEFHMQLLSNERRFILAVVAGALVIANRKKADIEAQLAADGYDRMPPSKKVAPPEAPQP